MEMSEIREKIDGIDSQIVELYKRRMEAVREIGAYKRAHGLPVYDSARERDLLNRVGELAGETCESGALAPAPFVNVPARPRRAGTFLLD